MHEAALFLEAEVLGMEAKDVSFDRRVVTFRPNQHRRLKSRNSHRTLPLLAQLEDIRHTYCAARLQTVDQGAPVSPC